MTESIYEHIQRISDQRSEALERAQNRIAELERELAEARKPLRWTSEVPRMSGWYWYRSDPNTFWKTIAHVIQRDFDDNTLHAYGQWSGPIPEPMP